MPSAHFEPPLALALAESLRHLDDVDRASVAATASLAELRQRVGGALPGCGSQPSAGLGATSVGLT